MKPSHPGEFIRRSIIPDELSVTKTAQLLGVGRPALSCLFNGKASLSPEMALRIEKAFGVKMDTLLRMQARLCLISDKMPIIRPNMLTKEQIWHRSEDMNRMITSGI